MTVDICSLWAYQEMLDSGKIGQRQAMYLSVFSETGNPYTRRQADELVRKKFNTNFLDRWDGRRLSELCDMGFLKKHDIVDCEFTKRLVNRWKYTGRRFPFPKHIVKITCPKCKGCGEVEAEQYYDPEDIAGQKELFNE